MNIQTVFEVKSSTALPAEEFKCAQILDNDYTIIVNSGDQQRSRQIASVLGQIFKESGQRTVQDAACKEVAKANRGNYPFVCTITQLKRENILV